MWFVFPLMEMFEQLFGDTLKKVSSKTVVNKKVNLKKIRLSEKIVLFMFLVVYKGVNYSNWDGAIKQWGKITTGMEH